MLSPIRVLVVDDSALIRQMLTHALSLDPRIEIAGIARTGVEAIEKAVRLEPDVITLDIEMPELTGLEALPFIIRDTRARVLMLSSLDDPETTYAALSAGAVDFIAKPKGGFASSLSDLADLLIKKIKIAYRIDPEKRLSVPGIGSDGDAEAGRSRPVSAGDRAAASRLVVLAASTGGPPALERVFSGLSSEASAAYLVVQHLPAGFTASFAKRLSRIAGFPILEGRQGLMIEPGVGYLAPHGTHMLVHTSARKMPTLALSDAPALHGVRPSADPMFESAAAAYGASVTGVVLTGMGQDGAAGMRAIRDAGGRTIVQDEASSVVWGMPGAAVRQGAAQTVVPLDRVAVEIRRTVREGS
ncbi:MAG: chemotaxis response regulator protein-glutamate methylesterase [Coriobacteriia bacterium]|nr:chemotaxis response regulator protein-glutamate methylesterase [Coriobacteriia bacterium]